MPYTYIKRQIKKWLYGSCPGFRGTLPYFGSKVYFPKNSLIFQMVCDQGIYESNILSAISALIRPDTAYFDIGANIGLLSIPILQLHPSCNVVSFEPSPNALPYLRRTANDSGFGERWQIVGKAVGSSEGEADFFIAKSELSAFDSIKNTNRAGYTQKTKVQLTTIDAEWNRMGRPKVSVIKIDVEGAEILVMNGAEKCISSERPCLLIEWNNLNLSAYDCRPETLLSFAQHIEYKVLSLPNFILVDSPMELKLHMIKTENFLLLPK